MAKLMRLDKYLADMGCGTRTQVKDAIKKGRVSISDEKIKSPETKIDIETTIVYMDGQPISYVQTEYYMLNKPQGVVSATEDRKYKTVIDLIDDKSRKDLFPVGRLDIDTEGLLLITNDGDLAHRLLSPKKHVDKTYYVELDTKIPANAKEEMLQGITLEEEFKTMPATLELLSETTCYLTIREGKFHQVKRMFEYFGCTVTYLKRISMGPLTLDETLKVGEYRLLTKEELLQLKSL